MPIPTERVDKRCDKIAKKLETAVDGLCAVRVVFEYDSVESAQLNERLHAYVSHVRVVANKLVAFEQYGH